MAGLRQPFPWETCGATRVRPVLAPRPPTEEATEVKAAAAYVGRPSEGEDAPRRGAEGAAQWVYDCLRRDPTAPTPDYEAIRARVSQAREITRRKKER